MPCVFMAKIVGGLLTKTADFSFCLTQCLMMALFYALDRLFHAASTTMSHKATFYGQIWFNRANVFMKKQKTIEKSRS